MADEWREPVLDRRVFMFLRIFNRRLTYSRKLVWTALVFVGTCPLPLPHSSDSTPVYFGPRYWYPTLSRRARCGRSITTRLLRATISHLEWFILVFFFFFVPHRFFFLLIVKYWNHCKPLKPFHIYIDYFKHFVLTHFYEHNSIVYIAWYNNKLFCCRFSLWSVNA